VLLGRGVISSSVESRSWSVAFFSALAFVTCVAVLVLIADPPDVVAAIIAVVAIGVVLRTFVPASVWARPRGRRVKGRAADHPQRATTEPSVDHQA
jgi:L-lactate permease